MITQSQVEKCKEVLKSCRLSADDRFDIALAIIEEWEKMKEGLPTYDEIFDIIFKKMDKQSRIWCDETATAIYDRLNKGVK